MPVWTDILVQRGRFSISEKGRSHEGLGLVNKEDVVKLLPSLFCKKFVTLANILAGALSC